MSTRGMIGFVVGDAEVMTYNHSDSYPDWLGVRILEFCAKTTDWDQVREQANRIVLVSEDTPPTAQQVKELIAEGVVNLSVSEQSTEDWYCLMREAQGSLKAYLELGLMPEGGSDFALNSLFCEWAYVVNLDTNMLEVYRGFQTEDHSEGRFAARAPGPEDEDRKREEALHGNWYRPIKLVAAWSLTELPDEKTFLSKLAETETLARNP